MSDESIDGLLRTAKAYARLPTAAQRREIRKKAGVTLPRMAEVIGVAPLTIHRWEQGRRPRADQVEAYVELLEALDEISKNGHA